MVVRADGCATCARRRNEEEAGRAHELHDEERDDGDGNGDVGLVGGRFVRGKRRAGWKKRAPSLNMSSVMRR